MGGRADCAPYPPHMKISWGDFLPDLPDHAAPGLSDAANVYPGPAGYRPVGQFVAHATALPTPCKGAQAFIAPSGRSVIIAGTASNLYRLSGTSGFRYRRAMR